MGKRAKTNSAYEWLEEDMGMCEKHPDVPVMFSLTGDYTPLCIACVQEYLTDDSKGDNNE